MEETELIPLRHQQQLMELPWAYRDCSWFFLIGGYGSAKSFADVFLILKLAQYYNGYRVRIGVGSRNITFFQNTVGADLDRILEESGLPYRFNGSKNYYEIGTVRFYIVPLEQPKKIYGYSYSAFIADEGDELAQDVFLESAKAIKERCRVAFPSITPEEKKYESMYQARMKIVPREQWNADTDIVAWKRLAHRPAYAVFSSTAQGLKGVWRQYEELKEKKIPVILIRARTIDNIHNDPDYYKNLWDIYTPIEREVFLDGLFRNLTQGRCYPQFDPETCVIDDFELNDGEEVILGQDLNLLASCATGFVVRGNVMYACREYTFKDFSMAATEIERSLPMQKKIMWPDASGTFILSGYLADMVQHGIEVRRMPHNPSIEERIMLINKLFGLGRLKVFKSLKQSIMSWQTRCYDDNGKPSKANRHPEPSDWMDSSEYATYQIASTRQEFFDIFSLITTRKLPAK